MGLKIKKSRMVKISQNAVDQQLLSLPIVITQRTAATLSASINRQ